MEHERDIVWDVLYEGARETAFALTEQELVRRGRLDDADSWYSEFTVQARWAHARLAALREVRERPSFPPGLEGWRQAADLVGTEVLRLQRERQMSFQAAMAQVRRTHPLEF